MTNDLFKEEFKVKSEEIKKALNWEIDYPCPNCGHKSREDAFKAIEITAGLSNWDCPNVLQNERGRIRTLMKLAGNSPAFGIQ